MSRQRSIWMLVAIVLLAVVIRSYALTVRSVWFDEAFTWRLIQFPWGEMLARDITDVHPPLYYLILKAWAVIFGSSTVALRSFSVLMGVATVAAGYLFTASALRSRGAAGVVALLLALSGFQIVYAWEMRMYTLGTCLALLASWLLLTAVRRTPPRLGWWIAYGVVAAAFAYVHYYALFTLAAHALFVAGYIVRATRGRLGEILQWRLTWYAVAGAVVALLCYVPWLPSFLEQSARVQAAFWIPPLGGWSVPDTFYRMLLPTSGIPDHTGVGAIILALLPLLGTVLVWLWLLVSPTRQMREHHDANVLIVALGAVPFLCSIAVSLLGQSLYQDRFLVFAQLFVVVAVAAAFWQLPLRQLRTILLVAIVVGFGVADVRYWRELNLRQKPGTQVAVTRLMAQRQTAEPIIVSSPFVFFAADHYAEEAHGAPDTLKLYSENGELVHFAGGPVLTPVDIVGPAFIQNPGHTTVWAIDTTGFGGATLPVPATWILEASEHFTEVYGYQGDIIVRKYRVR